MLFAPPLLSAKRSRNVRVCVCGGGGLVQWDTPIMVGVERFKEEVALLLGAVRPAVDALRDRPPDLLQ
jgi:hypothetical protein